MTMQDMARCVFIGVILAFIMPQPTESQGQLSRTGDITTNRDGRGLLAVWAAGSRLPSATREPRHLPAGGVWRRGFFLFPARNWVYAHAYGGLPTMMPDALGALNQQFQQGCYVAQQAAMAEQMGNVFAACQLYDQAIGLIANTIGMATQYGIPVTDNVFFSVAYYHFNAARLKAAAGWPQAVPAHLNFALQAVSQAIAINPNVYLYHSGAGRSEERRVGKE